MSERAAFWSDDFDMDLLKVLPELPEVLGETAGMKLWTPQSAREDSLIHPCVWNHRLGTVAFFGFGFHDSGKPDSYIAPHAHLVSCTFEEALRDAWVHSYIVLVKGELVFNAFALSDLFMRLMYHRRGWSALPDGEDERLVAALGRAVESASRKFAELKADHPEKETL